MSNPLQDQFLALLPRINAVATAQYRRNHIAGQPTLADTRQQAALIVWERMTGTSPNPDPIGSLYRDLMDWFRRSTHYRSSVVVQTTDEVPVTFTRFTPADLAAFADSEAVIRARVAALPTRHRSVVRQKAAGTKIRTIAADLGVSPSRVSQMLSAARAALGKAVSGR